MNDSKPGLFADRLEVTPDVVSLHAVARRRSLAVDKYVHLPVLGSDLQIRKDSYAQARQRHSSHVLVFRCPCGLPLRSVLANDPYLASLEINVGPSQVEHLTQSQATAIAERNHALPLNR